MKGGHGFSMGEQAVTVKQDSGIRGLYVCVDFDLMIFDVLVFIWWEGLWPERGELPAEERF